MLQKTINITSESGIHARPATLLVNKASSFTSNIDLEFNGKKVNLKSIMGVMSLGIGQGASVTFHVDGDDEQEALDAIVELMSKEGLGA
ncbi:phosphocarrier protein HPr [Longirhabdus pacifica]|uniref:phosphocarrier protein HPr n=1 Tax=Longirhabdus pacifica TaxID=2305227 RepID=UPI001009321E|nr:phosphocarrier protein HPr [Longirhabdus pacifica]